MFIYNGTRYPIDIINQEFHGGKGSWLKVIANSAKSTLLLSVLFAMRLAKSRTTIVEKSSCVQNLSLVSFALVVPPIPNRRTSGLFSAGRAVLFSHVFQQIAAQLGPLWAIQALILRRLSALIPHVSCQRRVINVHVSAGVAGVQIVEQVSCKEKSHAPG